MAHEGLIFDLDGTLVDSLPGIAEALNATLAEAGFPAHPEAIVRGFIGDGLDTTVRHACPEGLADATLVARLVDCFREHYAKAWKSGTRPYPGISELLFDLQADDALLGVLSNKSHAFTVEMVEAIFPEIRFAAVLGLRPGMTPKPDPGGALEIAAKLTLDPCRCIIIGDSTMDIDTAKHSGMRSCAVAWGYHDESRLIAAAPDAIVHDVDNLRCWLQRQKPQ
jgi:phosphoglycolate phosphatase